MKGLTRAAHIYKNRDERARELKAQGKRMAGYFCCYGPLELLASADYIPYRIQGDMNQPITHADPYMPTIICNFCRSCFDLGIKGKYDFLDAFIGVHSCDAVERTGAIWRSYIKYPCVFHLDIPHTSRPSAIDFFKKQLKHLQAVLEECSHKKVTNEQLNEMVLIYNRQRALVRELYNLRKKSPPLISGTEILQVMSSLVSIPVEEGNALLQDVIDEVKKRDVKQTQKKVRLLVMGCVLDDTAFTQLIEESGFDIVMDDTPIGTRTFWPDVELTEDPLDGIAVRYLDGIVCPQTHRETGTTREEDLENRFGYLKEFAKDWDVQGVYMNNIRNCDAHGYEIPELSHYLEEMVGVPLLVIEHDYSTAALGPLRTRFQAFSERLG